ncbi:MAG: hypothetical protein KME21_04920 [Desmonostoc vinosum HA7617-LM4]|jgi:hypothetical protein|nr:hypothetical protein [Desmonostoc vinosum HA7617-LM4]
MTNLDYPIFFLLLTALALAITKMTIALDKLDLERFYIWTSIACAIAATPMMLW